jgi:cysteine desulfurase
MGVEAHWAAGALRMTLGRTTTDADADRAVDILASAISTLRARRRPVATGAVRR